MTGTGPLNPNNPLLPELISTRTKPVTKPQPTESEQPLQPELSPEDLMKAGVSVMGGMASEFVAFVEETQNAQQEFVEQKQSEQQEFVEQKQSERQEFVNQTQSELQQVVQQAAPEIAKMGTDLFHQASHITGNPLFQIAVGTVVETNTEMAVLSVQVQSESTLLNGKQQEVKSTQASLDRAKSFQEQLFSPQTLERVSESSNFAVALFDEFQQLTADISTPDTPPPKIEMRHQPDDVSSHTANYNDHLPGETTRVSASLESGNLEVFVNDQKMDGKTALEFMTSWMGRQIDYGQSQLELKKQEQTAIEESLVGKVNQLKGLEQTRDEAMTDVRLLSQTLPPDQQKQGNEIIRGLDKQSQLTDEMKAKAVEQVIQALQNSGYSPEQIKQMFNRAEDEDSQESVISVPIKEKVASGLSGKEDSDTQTPAFNQAETIEQEQARLEQVFQDKKELQDLAQKQIERSNLLEKLNRERLAAEHQAELLDAKRSQMDKELATKALEKMTDE